MAIDHTILGQIIREERERRQLSQESLAALAGLSRTFIGDIERGVSKISLESLAAVADGLGIKPSEIVIEYENRCAFKQ